ncbi:MAG TPA: response regulator transcription factor [Patescibacteria group bacterium]|nr:response regulator transcription factor [Patescibacteria group bacterium]
MRILLVEDEKKIADFIKRGLKEEGYSVDVAADGQEGDFLAATETYDLLILDLMLPKVDGITLCKKLRHEKVPAPILMLTAKDTVKDKVRGLDAGADDYLTKPFAFEELLARIRALLRKNVSASATVLAVADLTLDVVSHKVVRSGRQIDLTAKEYAMLEYFMRNTGSVVTRTMLSEHVWDIHFDTLTNVIDVYVNHLRNKIDRGFKKQLLLTVRGRGYTLKE